MEIEAKRGIEEIKQKNTNAISRMISAAENCPKKHVKVLSKLESLLKNLKSVLGITGTGGAGKSSC